MNRKTAFFIISATILLISIPLGIYLIQRSQIFKPKAAETILAYDNFNRANNITSLGNSDSGQAWTAEKGVWGISNNAAYSVTACPAPGYATINTNLVDGTFQITVPINKQDVLIPFRFIDTNNLYQIVNGGPLYKIEKKVNGTVSLLAEISGITPTNNDTIIIKSSGDQITITILPVTGTKKEITVSDSSLKGTKYGIGNWCNNTVRFKDMLFVANTTPSPSPSPSPTGNIGIGTSIPYQTKVLVIKYFPTDSTGLKLDPNIAGTNDTITNIRAKVDSLNSQAIQSLTNGTKYHGYKDATASASLNYSIFDSKEFLQPLPLGLKVPWGSAYRPDYKKILNDNNICDYIDNKGVKQVWFWGYHYGSIEPVESNMSMGTNSRAFWTNSTYGDISNSERTDDLPICKKTYVLYNYNYTRGLGEMLEDHGHHLESVMNFVDYNLFWQKWVSPFGLTNNQVNHCGWTHSPPNTNVDYLWNSETTVKSDCEDWKPEGGGQVKDINCHTWYGSVCKDNSGVEFKVWWMQNLPGYNNNLTYQGKKLRNWWEFYGDLDQALAKGKTAFESSSQPSPSPNPSSSPIITPSPSGNIGIGRTNPPSPSPSPTPIASPSASPSPSQSPSPSPFIKQVTRISLFGATDLNLTGINKITLDPAGNSGNFSNSGPVIVYYNDFTTQQIPLIIHYRAPIKSSPSPSPIISSPTPNPINSPSPISTPSAQPSPSPSPSINPIDKISYIYIAGNYVNPKNPQSIKLSIAPETTSAQFFVSVYYANGETKHMMLQINNNNLLKPSSLPTPIPLPSLQATPSASIRTSSNPSPIPSASTEPSPITFASPSPTLHREPPIVLPSPQPPFPISAIKLGKLNKDVDLAPNNTTIIPVNLAEEADKNNDEYLLAVRFAPRNLNSNEQVNVYLASSIKFIYKPKITAFSASCDGGVLTASWPKDASAVSYELRGARSINDRPDDPTWNSIPASEKISASQITTCDDTTCSYKTNEKALGDKFLPGEIYYLWYHTRNSAGQLSEAIKLPNPIACQPAKSNTSPPQFTSASCKNGTLSFSWTGGGPKYEIRIANGLSINQVLDPNIWGKTRPNSLDLSENDYEGNSTSYNVGSNGQQYTIWIHSDNNNVLSDRVFYPFYLRCDGESNVPKNLIYQCLGNSQVKLSWDTVKDTQKYLIRIDNKNSIWGGYNVQTGDIVDDNVQTNSYTATITPNEPYAFWVQSIQNDITSEAGQFSGNFTCP